MIAPHQGKELTLMLAGKKHLAVFYDAIVPNVDILEDIIPEQAFAPYVKNKKLCRFSKDMRVKDGSSIRYVCFTTPENTWRADAFFWAKAEGFSGLRPFDASYETFIGRLLDYSEEDIRHFINNK